MVRGVTGSVLVVAVLGALGGLVYWLDREGYLERGREEARIESVKIAARRVELPGGEVAIRLDASTQRRIGLVTAPVEAVQWQKTVTLLGFSIVVPHRFTEVRSPWTGILQSPPAGAVPAVGKRVERGQVLGILQAQWSPADRIQLENQLREAQGAAGETEAEIQVARKSLARLRQVDTGAIASKQIVDAEGSLAKLDARLSSARAREKALQTALGKGSEIEFSFAAPQGGQITKVARRPGEVILAGDLVATIYDPSEFWVSASSLPGQLESVEPPGKAEIRFPGFEFPPLAARLAYAAVQTEGGQQARQLVYSGRNPQGRIPVGLQAVVKIKVGRPEKALAVKRSAVLERGGQRVVYLQRGPEDFVRQVVEVRDEEADRAHLRPSLPADARVVEQGAQVLLAEEYKESIQLVEEGGKGEENRSREQDEK